MRSGARPTRRARCTACAAWSWPTPARCRRRSASTRRRRSSPSPCATSIGGSSGGSMRADGTPIPSLHPLRRIMPFIMPTRNGAFVLFEQDIPTAPLHGVLERLNADRPADRRVTFFHCVLHAIGVALTEFPRLNRFVVGSRLYDRRGIWLAFSPKQRTHPHPPTSTPTIPYPPPAPPPPLLH